MNDHQIEIGDKVYYARVLYESGVYEICELKIRTVTDTWFVGVDKRDKHSYLFNLIDLNKYVFTNRNEALSVVKEAEKHKRVFKDEDTIKTGDDN